MICSPVSCIYIMTQWSVLQCLISRPWPSDLQTSALHLDHDPVICSPLSNLLIMTQWFVVQCLASTSWPSDLYSSVLYLDHDPVICSPLSNLLIMTQWYVVQCLTSTSWLTTWSYVGILILLSYLTYLIKLHIVATVTIYLTIWQCGRHELTYIFTE